MVETDVSHRDMIYLDSSVLYFFYTKELIFNRLKSRFKLNESFLQKRKNQENIANGFKAPSSSREYNCASKSISHIPCNSDFVLVLNPNRLEVKKSVLD